MKQSQEQRAGTWHSMVSTCLTLIHESPPLVQAHKWARDIQWPTLLRLVHRDSWENCQMYFWNPGALCLGYVSSSNSLVAVLKKGINLVCHVSFMEIMLSPNVKCFLCKHSQTICFVIWTRHFGEFTLGAIILAFPSVYILGGWGIHPSAGILFFFLFSFQRL